jgi:hypothetical protein
MITKKVLSAIWIALLAGAVLITPAFAGMAGSGGGMGGTGDGRVETSIGSNLGTGEEEPGSGLGNRLASRMKSTTGTYTFNSMHRASTGTMADGGVKMEMEPYSFEAGTLRVKFYANTHSVNLGDYEMMGRTHLEYGDMEYIPVSIDRMRGHHAGGEIEFNLPEAPDHFRIVVRGLPDLEERIFEW